MTLAKPFPPFRFLLMEVGGIKHYQPGPFTARGSGNNFTAKALGVKKWQATAMVEMGMREQYVVDVCRVEAEGFAVFFFQLVTSLEHAAIDQEAMVAGFHQETRTGYARGGTVK